MKFRNALFLVALVPVTSLAVVPGVDDTSTKYFGYVGQFGGASAVAVGSNVFLTAKHVGGTIGSIFTLPAFSESFIVTGRYNDPDADFSVLSVAGTLPGYYSITTQNVVSNNAQITMVGYGPTGTTNGAGNGYTITGGSGIRHYGENTVDLDQTLNLSSAEGFNPPSPASTSLVSILKNIGDSALTGGDSGGGWFYDDHGVQRLVGINSFVGTAGDGVNYQLPKYDVHGNLTGYFASGAVELRDYVPFLEAHGVPAPVPEPSTWAGLAMGMGFCLSRVSRRRRTIA